MTDKPANKMWGGRFAMSPAEVLQEINASIDFDKVLAPFDVRASKVHATMLAARGIISKDDARKITSGLDRVLAEIEGGGFTFSRDLEDIHMNVEARLQHLVGPAAGRLHTARSRNDQVATDFRLYLRDWIDGADRGLAGLQLVLARKAEAHAELAMPGFTHLQPAQPVTFGHHLLAYVEMLKRDRGRFADARARLNECPLGAAALAILVVSEVALACMLLVGAGLLLRSFMNVLNVDLGFEPDRAAAIKVAYDDNVPNDKDGDLRAAKRGVIFQQILSRVGALPGVEAAGTVDYLPLGRNRAWGLPFPKGVKRPEKIDSGPLVYVISPGYMRAMGTSIRGRDFAWSDAPKSEQVVMINKSFAKFLAGYAKWPNGDAVGQALTNGNTDLKIVGVVDDVHEENVDGEAGWQIYYPMIQATPNGAELVVRTRMIPPLLLVLCWPRCAR